MGLIFFFGKTCRIGKTNICIRPSYDHHDHFSKISTFHEAFTIQIYKNKLVPCTKKQGDKNQRDKNQEGDEKQEWDKNQEGDKKSRIGKKIKNKTKIKKEAKINQTNIKKETKTKNDQEED